MSIEDNVKSVKANIKKTLANSKLTNNVKLVAVTKYVDDEKMQCLYNLGIKCFGENRVEKFLQSKNSLSKEDIEWHFIGSLQSKKVKKVINEIDYLHSLDRMSLAEEIEKHSIKKLNCFVQVKTSDEQSKHGISPVDVLDFIKGISEFTKINIVGLMNITTCTSDMDKHKEEFQLLAKLQKEVQNLKLDYAPCTELSMGMSADYELAIESGATVIRVGSVLF